MIPPREKIVETKKCRISGEEFVVTDKDLEFYDKVSPVFAGKKYSIPSPTLCPEERLKNRLSWRNERNLYKRKSSLSEKEIISIYPADSEFIIYSPHEWYSDTWSGLNYGANFDFSKGFFEQFQDLCYQVPQLGLNQSLNENSVYAHEGIQNKSSYLLFAGSQNDNVYYGYFAWRNQLCVDCMYIKDSENCYQCIDVNKCFGVSFSQSCSSCSDSQHLLNCNNCSECYGCVNLNQKRFFVLNKQLTEEQFKQFKHDIAVNPELKTKFLDKYHVLCRGGLHKNIYGFGNQDSFGDHIYNSKNIFDSFEVDESEDVKYSISTEKSNNIHDCYMARMSDFCYSNEVSTVGCSHVLFSSIVFNQNSRIYYSRSINNSSDLFGCVGLHNHEHHCILNKPYSVSEYETLCGKIIDHMRSTGEWGEFFPHELSPFGYNETVAQEYFPMTEGEVKSRGWNWHTEEVKIFEGTPYAPLSIREYDEKIVGFELAQRNIDTLLGGTIQCEVTGKPFKIIKQELVFYIENNLPVPTKHPDQRHKERMDLRNPRKLYERTCAECQKSIITTYSPDRPEKVVCEECYRKIVY